MQGERPMAADNKSIGKFTLKGIKRAPAGTPQILVSFDIDANGILTVTAKDLGTGNEQSITITDSERMSDAEIAAAIADAEKYAAEDNARRESMEERNHAQSLVARADEYIKDQGKDLPKEERKAIKNATAAVQKYLMKKPEKMKDEDKVAFSSAIEHLESLI
jgi:molecular chaperone DnaK